MANPRLGEWSDKALWGMENGLRKKTGNPLLTELDQARKRIGELFMDYELLRWKCGAPTGGVVADEPRVAMPVGALPGTNRVVGPFPEPRFHRTAQTNGRRTFLDSIPLAKEKRQKESFQITEIVVAGLSG